MRQRKSLRARPGHINNVAYVYFVGVAPREACVYNLVLNQQAPCAPVGKASRQKSDLPNRRTRRFL